MYRYLNLVLAAAGLLGGATFATAAHAQSATCDTPTTPFCAAIVPLPANWTGHVFALSQDYPASAPQDVQPWLAFDPTTQPGEYLKTVFDYFYDGNILNDAESSFDPKLNSKRMWFHAPWQDAATDTNTREPIHGLTRERVSRAAELASQQTHEWNNYAVGFYSAPGGVVIGQVWADHGNPDRSKAKSFPEGTVARCQPKRSDPVFWMTATYCVSSGEDLETLGPRCVGITGAQGYLRLVPATPIAEVTHSDLLDAFKSGFLPPLGRVHGLHFEPNEWGAVAFDARDKDQTTADQIVQVTTSGEIWAIDQTLTWENRESKGQHIVTWLEPVFASRLDSYRKLATERLNVAGKLSVEAGFTGSKRSPDGTSPATSRIYALGKDRRKRGSR